MYQRCYIVTDNFVNSQNTPKAEKWMKQGRLFIFYLHVQRDLATCWSRDVSLVEFMHPVFIARQVELTVGESGLCCCVPEDVSLVEFMCPVFIACQVELTVGESGLCCCVPEDVSLVEFLCPVFIACQVELAVGESGLWFFSCARGCLLGGVYVPCIYCIPGGVSRRRIGSLFLCVPEDVSWVEFMCPVFIACQVELAVGESGLCFFCVPEDVSLVECMYPVFIATPGGVNRRRIGSLLLCACSVWRQLFERKNYFPLFVDSSCWSVPWSD